MGHKISKEQIDPGVKDHIMSFVGDIADLETEVNTDIISAVNSLMVDRVDNAENMGKLANAIGEPVTANHSVDEVVEGLGEMLSTFKTNMMNSGVMVESSDKFKQLIDKIKGLTEGEGNKGIQFAEGIVSNSSVQLYEAQEYGIIKPKTITVETNLKFTPTFIFMHIPGGIYSNYSSNSPIEGCLISNISPAYITHASNFVVKIQNINNNKFDIYTNTLCKEDENYSLYMCGPYSDSSSETPHSSNEPIRWYAIGIGEEDTTLRDSLADILENKGVYVTEEDDMASLITKVDSIQTGGSLDIISATELPATGKENQICVITDNPVDNFMITSDITHYNGDINVIMAHTSIVNNNVEPLVLINDNMTQYIHFFKMIQGNAVKKSYIYKNNEWIEYTPAELVLLRNGVIYNEMYNPDDYGSMGYDTTYEEGKGLTITVETDSYNYDVFSSYTRIDFSLYNTLFIKIQKLDNYAHTCVALAVDSKPYGALDKDEGIAYTYSFSTPAGVTRELYIDVSAWTGEYYLAIGPEGTDNTYSFLISDVYLY